MVCSWAGVELPPCPFPVSPREATVYQFLQVWNVSGDCQSWGLVGVQAGRWELLHLEASSEFALLETPTPGILMLLWVLEPCNQMGASRSSPGLSSPSSLPAGFGGRALGSAVPPRGAAPPSVSLITWVHLT